MMKKAISVNLYQKCLILYSKILQLGEDCVQQTPLPREAHVVIFTQKTVSQKISIH